MRPRTTVTAGAKRDASFALPAEYFDGTVNEPVLHQAVKVFLNNQRQGTASTKTRSFVSGGNQKPWKQKGTGRARQGSTRAPHWRGGGIVFGPHPRDYRTEIPRKVKQLARKSALNARAREGALHVVERFAFRRAQDGAARRPARQPRPRRAKVLVLTAGANENVYLSGRNLPTVEVMPYFEASAYDVLWSDAVVVEEGALTGVMPEPLPDEPEAEPKPEAAPPPGQARGRQEVHGQARRQGEGQERQGGEGRQEVGREGRQGRQIREEGEARQEDRGQAGQEGRAEEEEREQVMPALHQIVVRPVVTEKSSAAYQTRREYTFEVHPEANKYQIRDALQQLFGVTVTDVRTMQMRRHAVTRGRTRGTTARWKKAIVTLKDGDSIAVFEG